MENNHGENTFAQSFLICHRQNCLNECKHLQHLKGGHLSMTQMQAEYAKILETRRHDLATEAAQKFQNETQRYSAVETARHYRVSEALSAADLQEKIEHDRNTEAETMRHNGATEAEVKRHDEAMEKQAIADNNLKRYLGELDAATKVQISEAQLQNARDIAQYQGELQRAINNATNALKKYEIDTNAYLKSADLEISREKVELQRKQISQDLTIATTNAILRSQEIAVDKARVAVQQAQNDLNKWKAEKDVEHMSNQDQATFKKLENDFWLKQNELAIAEKNAETAEKQVKVAQAKQNLDEIKYGTDTGFKIVGGLWDAIKTFKSWMPGGSPATAIGKQANGSDLPF